MGSSLSITFRQKRLQRLCAQFLTLRARYVPNIGSVLLRLPKIITLQRFYREGAAYTNYRRLKIG